MRNMDDAKGAKGKDIFTITSSGGVTPTPALSSASSLSALVGSGDNLSTAGARRRVLAAYWVLGLCNDYGYVIMLSAAVDILGKQFGLDGTGPIPGPRMCNGLSTGAILIADSVPALIIKCVSPFFPLWIHTRMASVVALNVAGYLLVALAPSLWVALLGVVCMSLACGLGEVTLLAYTAFYKDKFWLLMVHPRLDSSGEAMAPGEKIAVVEVQDDVPMQVSNASIVDKLRDVPPLLKYIVPFTLVYLFEYFINQGLYELIHYENVEVGGRQLDHTTQYEIFQVMYQIGLFISRSSGSLVHIERIWIFSLLQALNVVLFVAEAVYSFAGSLWVVVAVVLWEGLLGGGAYVNMYFCNSKQVAPEKREFSMAMSSVGDAVGILAAAFLAMPVHNALCQLPTPH